MYLNLDNYQAWLTGYQYLILFPLVAIEGPIITIIAGFLCSLGILDFRLAYLTIVVADTASDSFYYALGRFGRNHVPAKFLAFIGLKESRIQLARHYFDHHPKKTFAIGKISHGIGAVPLFAAGLIRFPFGQFILYNFILTAVKSALLLAIGFYFGRAALNIKTYLDYTAIFAVIIGIGLYLGFIYYAKTLEKKNDRSHE